MNNFEKILFLKSCRGIGNTTINKTYIPLLSSCGSLSELRTLILQKSPKLTINDLDIAEQSYYSILDSLRLYLDISITTVLDPEYPKRLNDMGYSKPPLLYYVGNLALCNYSNLAVVGTRNPSEWSKTVEPRLVKKAIELSNLNILSGLALGCDTIAHETALNANTKTIAVLPSGLQKIYPHKNAELACSIVERGGCLISEYSPLEESSKYTFIARDKIIAALSIAVVAIECDEKSGTMTTIQAAYEFKRKIGCYYPDDMNKGDYSGNQLIVDKYKGIKVNDTEDLKFLINI